MVPITNPHTGDRQLVLSCAHEETFAHASAAIEQLINTNMTLEQGTVSPNAQGVIYLPQGSSSSDREAELSVEEDESMASALDQVLSAPQNAASHHVQADFSSGRSTTSEESTITDTACITSEWCFQPCQQDGTTDDSGQEGNVPYIAYNEQECLKLEEQYQLCNCLPADEWLRRASVHR